MYGKPLRVQMEKKNILHDTTKIKACSKEEIGQTNESKQQEHVETTSSK